MNCLIMELIVITSSLGATTVVDHSLITRHRVQFATWEVDQQSSWFQQEHSVRTAGPPSTPDIWRPKPDLPRESAAATFAGTRRRKSQLAEETKTKHWCTLLRSSVERCRVPSIPLGESWPASFALNDVFNRWKAYFVIYIVYCRYINFCELWA